MKILFPYMARWNSANMSRYYHLFRRVADIGHTVIVVQPPARTSQETNYIDLPMEPHPNILLHTAQIPGWLWNTRFPLDKFVKKAIYTLFSWKSVRDLAGTQQPDVIVIYNLPQYIYLLGSHIPVIFDYADDYRAMLVHELGIADHHPVLWLTDDVTRRIIHRSVLVTAVSGLILESVDCAHKLLLPNGADEPESLHTDTVLHIERDKPVIGYVGAFEYFIDLDLMLEAARRLPQCRFLYVGAGREYPRVKEYVAERKLQNVLLTGAVPHHQAMQFISEMDICLNLFVKCRVADAASPIKLFEYMIRRKPVISTRLQEVGRIDNGTDALYYADTAEEVVSEVRRILDNPSERDRKTGRGAELVRKEYSWPALAAHFVSAMQNNPV